MCGRYLLERSVKEAIERFQIQQLLFEATPRYNIAPSQTVPVILDDDNNRILDGFRWGLIPHWAKDESIGYKMINARAETVHKKPSFKNALKSRRCLIPADGFYEWKKEEKTKQPMMIRLKRDALFAFAGLWEEWKGPKGIVRSCTIITTEPNELMAPIHDRMPVILPKDYEDAWLDPEWRDIPEILELLRPYPAEQMKAIPVSTLVNSPRNENADVIVPLGAFPNSK